MGGSNAMVHHDSCFLSFYLRDKFNCSAGIACVPLFVFLLARDADGFSGVYLYLSVPCWCLKSVSLVVTEGGVGPIGLVEKPLD